MSDILTESPEEAAALKALQDEAPIELVEPDPEPQPEPEPKPEHKPEAQPEPRKPPVRLVPHEALHEERVKRQALERELVELRKPRPAATQEPSADIDENENPLGAIGALKAQIKALRDERESETAANNQTRDIIARMAPRVEAYAKEHPEYGEQHAYLRNSRAQELSLLGHAPDAIAAQIQREEMALAHHTLQHDLDPGEVMAKMSIARGWRAKETEPKPAEAALPKAEPDAEKKIERLQAGQRAAKSPSAAGGSGPAPEMTLERLVELDGAAFDQAFEKRARRLMDG